jgi:hypothetical protein
VIVLSARALDMGGTFGHGRVGVRAVT